MARIPFEKDQRIRKEPMRDKFWLQPIHCSAHEFHMNIKQSRIFQSTISEGIWGQN